MLAVGLTLTAILSIALVWSIGARASGADAPDLAALAKPPAGWRSASPPTTAAGEGLYDVINGGAVMYMQCGFRRAVFASFQNPEGLLVNLEIYAMNDPEAARTVFSQKAGGSGRKMPYGRDARLEAHYLNFWRGRYQVTISGYAASPETEAAIRKVAAMVDKRLQGG